MRSREIGVFRMSAILFAIGTFGTSSWGVTLNTSSITKIFDKNSPADGKPALLGLGKDYAAYEIRCEGEQVVTGGGYLDLTPDAVQGESLSKDGHAWVVVLKRKLREGEAISVSAVCLTISE